MLAAQAVLAHKLVEGAAVLLRNACRKRDIAAGPGQETVEVNLLELCQRLRLGGPKRAVELAVREAVRHLVGNRAQLDHIAFGENQFT